MNIPDSLKSRKFWMAIIAALVVFLNKWLDVNLNITEIIAFITPLVSFIFVEGAADIKSRNPEK